QHLGAQRQLTGEAGLLEALRGLEGFEAPAVEWERSLLPQRVANYDARWLDLCLARREIPEVHLTASLSDLANRARSYLGERGAMFPGDLARVLGATADESANAL